MKFNKLAVVGNPPYQKPDKGESTGAKPIYHLFIESIIDNLNPRYFSFIVPSRWMIGGKGLNNFRKRMINDRRLSKISHFPGEREIFTTVNIKGGVNYFLWDKEYNDKCEFQVGNTSIKRFLNKYDIVVQDNNAVSILDKIKLKTSNWINQKCLSRKPFGLRTNFSNWSKEGVTCISRGKKTHLVEREQFTDKNKIIDKWKVCTSKGASGSYLTEPRGLLFYFILKPNQICTETYIVVNTFSNKEQAENFLSYMKTKFFRFMLGLRVLTQDISKDKFSWVPDVEDYSTTWTDTELYKKYNLTRQEIAYIESKIKKL